MASIKEALKVLYKLEFNRPEKALHKNKGEFGLTFMGIYQTANPNLSLWEDIALVLDENDGDLRKASKILYNDKNILEQVEQVYKHRYWDKAKLDRVKSQKIANEIFVFGVNVGMRNAIRKAQKLVGVTADGIVGSQTLKAWNSYDEDKFDYKFDEIEEQFYSDLIAHKPSLAIYKRGWFNRAEAV